MLEIFGFLAFNSFLQWTDSSESPRSVTLRPHFKSQNVSADMMRSSGISWRPKPEILLKHIRSFSGLRLLCDGAVGGMWLWFLNEMQSTFLIVSLTKATADGFTNAKIHSLPSNVELRRNWIWTHYISPRHIIHWGVPAVGKRFASEHQNVFGTADMLLFLLRMDNWFSSRMS